MKYVLVSRINDYNLWLALYEIKDGPDSEGYVMGYKLMGIGEERLAYVHPTMGTYDTLEKAIDDYKCALSNALKDLKRKELILAYQFNELHKLEQA